MNSIELAPPCAEKSLQRYFDFVSLDHNLKTLDSGQRIHGRSPAGQTVDPSMPGALNRKVILIYEAFAQGSAAMSANIVERIELPIGIEQGDGPSVDLYDDCAPGREVACVHNLHKLGHRKLPSLFGSRRFLSEWSISINIIVVPRTQHLSNRQKVLSSCIAWRTPVKQLLLNFRFRDQIGASLRR